VPARHRLPAPPGSLQRARAAAPLPQVQVRGGGGEMCGMLE
jgi:hypothetical protein